MFDELARELENGRRLRDTLSEASKRLESVSRALQSKTEVLHSIPWPTVLSENILTQDCCSSFQDARKIVREIHTVLGPADFWKYSDLWAFAMQRFTACAALLCFAFTGDLITKSEAVALLIDNDDKRRPSYFALTTEDYLHGLITAINELSRLSVNAVTMGDFLAPQYICNFLKRLQSGFQLLNLKNDSLRRRFDSVKYDVKKTEEVVYDLTLRGLTKAAEDGQQHLQRLGQPSDVNKATYLNRLGGRDEDVDRSC